MQPPSHVSAKTSPTTASIEPFSADSSYKVSVSLPVASVQKLVSNKFQNQTKYLQKRFPLLHFLVLYYLLNVED